MKLRRVVPVVAAVFCAIAAVSLVRELVALGPWRIVSMLGHQRPGVMVGALALVVVNYFVLTCQDQLAFAYVGRRLARWRIGLASFVGYAVSNSVAAGGLSGAAVRYRFYERWDIDPADLARIVLFYSATFWLGLLVLGGASLAFAPPTNLEEVVPHSSAHVAGWILMGTAAGYVVACGFRRAPVRLGGVELAVPSVAIACAQVAISTLDWLLAAAVFHTLLPSPRPPFLTVAGAFTAAQLAGLVSHVPGALGVFEGLILLFLKPVVTPGVMMPVLILYRVLYYLIPLAAALLVLAGDEALQRHPRLRARAHAVRTAARALAPPVLAVVTFGCGAILLASGATPADPGRVARLARVMPLPLLEASHFTASLVGLLLLFLAQAIARRVDAALYLTSAALAIGSVTSLLKGADYEEAAVLAVAFMALVTAHRTFTRRARLFDKPMSRGWLMAVALVVAASVWLGFFTYRHVAYSSDLWWRFAFSADAPRFLRTSVAVTVVALGAGVRSLLRPVVPGACVDRGTDDDVDAAIARQTRTMPNLVYLGDKATMWNKDRSAFVMYGVHGRSWIALGDPVGAADASRDLVRLFLETTRDIGVTPVFYQVSAERLGDYADYGLAFVKIGEEARVWLPSFTLSGAHQKALRAVVNRMEREGATFRVVPPGEVARLMPELREISDEWVSAKRTAEKGFSLGFFQPDYISRFPVALIERAGHVEAFANLWLGAGGVELSPDLMRHRESAPKGIMDALLTHTMLWGRDRGYDWFNLGVAPLSGLPLSPVGHPWGRLGRFVYRYGEGYYNFRGLRAYKEKFHPVWQPRYLVYPGGLTLPRVLADVTALVAGGYRQIFVRGGRHVA